MRFRLLKSPRFLALLGLGLAFGACASPILHPNEHDAARAGGEWPGTTTEDLGRGRARYVSKCSGCHTLHAPASRPEAEWRTEIRRMAERAALTADEERDITRYVVTIRVRSE